MQVNLSSRSIIKSLIILAVILIAAHAVSHILITMSVNQITEVFIEKFSLEGEGNFPAFFSSFLLFFSAVLFGIISKGTKIQQQQNWKYWSGLALIFVFLSLDEAVQLHEKLDTDLIWASVNTGGLLAWPWVILYGALVMIIAIIYFRFWLNLPAAFRIAYACAAALYVGSALGFEMLEALEYTTNGGTTPKYIMLTSIEEALEMSAIIYLIAINLKYIRTMLPDLSISFHTEKTLRA